MEDLGAHAQGLAEAGSAHRHDHELLDLHVVGGVCAAVEDIHHGHGQLLCVNAADIVVQGGAQALSRGLCAGQGGAQDGVGTQAALVGRTVQGNQLLVNRHLIQHILTHQGIADLGIDVVHSVLDALAQITALIAVTQLTCLINAGGRTGGNRSTAHSTVFQIDLYLNCRVAAAVQDLAADDINNLNHLLHGNQTPFNSWRNALPLASGIIEFTRAPVCVGGLSNRPAPCRPPVAAGCPRSSRQTRCRIPANPGAPRCLPTIDYMKSPHFCQG